MFKDIVRVADAGLLRLRNKAGGILAGRDWDSGKSVVHVEGWVKLVMRERGKIVRGTHREGHNIWTNTGREFLAMLMSLQTPPANAFRNDRVAFIGAGVGAQVEDPGVVSLVSPVPYVNGVFLAPLDTPPTFPLTTARTTVRYRRTFLENEITILPGSQVNISEMGLFTNGRQSDYTVGLRDTTLGASAQQSPVAYKTFEPVGKKDTLQLEVSWEIRF